MRSPFEAEIDYQSHLEHLPEAGRARVGLVEVEDDADLLLEALGVDGLQERDRRFGKGPPFSTPSTPLSSSPAQ